MVAKRIRTVFHPALPRLRAVLAGGATSQIAVVFEVRDRETYYTELRFAVQCQSRSIPLPREAPPRR